jgi:DNA-binding winged helix-turn-helix (wHTH) protein/tetratricopeptide (TPR) repeat protein
MAVDLARESDFELGSLTVRPPVRQVESAGRSDTLEPRIMQVLVLLARRRGEVVSRDDLLETCWSGMVVGEDSLNRCIYKLRKLGETTSAFTVETIAKVGYRLTVLPDTSAPQTTADPAGANPPRIRRLVVLSAAVLVVVLAAVAAMLATRNSKSVEIRASRIAVLAFDVVGDSPEAAAAARRAPGAISDALQRTGEMVLSPAMGASYAGERKPAAAGELGVDYVIDGEFSGDDRLHLRLRLSNARGVIIWSDEVTGELQEPADIFDQASVLSANALQGLRRLPFDNSGTGENQAAYLRAMDRLDRGDMVGSWTQARRLAAAEPGNAEALLSAAIAGAYMLGELPFNERASVLAEVRGYVERARTIDPAAPSLPIAIVATTPGVEFEHRQQVLSDGLVAQPDSAELRTELGTELMKTGRIAEGIIYLRRAAVLDPVSRNKAWQPLYGLVLAGRYPEAIKESERAIRLWPDFYSVVRPKFEAALWSGDYAEASRQLADPSIALLIQPMAPVMPLESIVKALETRNPLDAEEAAALCANPGQLKVSSTKYCLSALSSLGRMDDAFALIDQIYPRVAADTREMRDQLFVEHAWTTESVERLFHISSTALREDPRIVPVFDRLGLLDYWRSSGKWPDFCETEPRSVCARMKAS